MILFQSTEQAALGADDCIDVTVYDKKERKIRICPLQGVYWIITCAKFSCFWKEETWNSHIWFSSVWMEPSAPTNSTVQSMTPRCARWTGVATSARFAYTWPPHDPCLLKNWVLESLRNAPSTITRTRWFLCILTCNSLLFLCSSMLRASSASSLELVLLMSRSFLHRDNDIWTKISPIHGNSVGSKLPCY